jgi:hypothetical protein
MEGRARNQILNCEDYIYTHNTNARDLHLSDSGKGDGVEVHDVRTEIYVSTSE